MSAAFSDVQPEALLKFVREYPLAWVVPEAKPAAAMLMALVVETDEEGLPAYLIGHLPKHSPAAKALAEDTSATCLFLGPNAYMQPQWVSQTKWGPTWNFVSLKLGADLALSDDLAAPALQALTTQLEDTKGSAAWSTDQMGERFEQLLKALTGFRAPISSMEPRFKLGQDENETTFDELLAGLGDHPLAGWMSGGR